MMDSDSDHEQSHCHWDKKIGLKRLTNLGNVPPRAPPWYPDGAKPMHEDAVSSAHMDPDVPMEKWLDLLHNVAWDVVDPELMEDRVNIWRKFDQHEEGHLPPWMTLMPSVDLKEEYQELLEEDLKLDSKALDPFIKLVRRGPMGYSEACRVLAHGLKDKTNPQDPRHDIGPDGVDRDPTGKSMWFKAASDEAN